jgi:hypothetical protein
VSRAVRPPVFSRPKGCLMPPTKPPRTVCKCSQPIAAYENGSPAIGLHNLRAGGKFVKKTDWFRGYPEVV